jgi:hypothetical protein
LNESRGSSNSKAPRDEAVIIYRESLATQEMGRHRLSRKVKKMGFKIDIYNFRYGFITK